MDLERRINRFCDSIIDAGSSSKNRYQVPLDTAFESYMTLVKKYSIQSHDRVKEIQNNYQEAQDKLKNSTLPKQI